MPRLLTLTLGLLLGALLLPAAALADQPTSHLALPIDQTWLILISGLVPLVGYVLNHHAAWVTEQVKGIVQVLLAAVTGGVYQAVQAGGVGWNGKTAEYVLTAVVGALAAHHWLWKPTSISTELGAGSNAPRA